MKWSIFFINLLFLVFGIVLIVLGANASKDLAGQLSSNTLPDGIIVMGVFIMLVSFFGFFSAWKEWRPGLGIFAFIVFLLAIILIAVAIAVYVEKNNAAYYIAEGWASGGTNVQISAMVEFNCCGLNGPNEDDYFCAVGWLIATDGTNITNPPVAQCCLPNSGVNSTAKYLPNTNANSCLNILVNDFNSYFVPAGSAGIAFAVLMLVALVFIGLLMKGIRLKNLNLEVLKNRQRNETERAERRKGIQLPDNVL